MDKILGTERLFYDTATKTIYERMENGDLNPVRISGAPPGVLVVSASLK